MAKLLLLCARAALRGGGAGDCVREAAEAIKSRTGEGAEEQRPGFRRGRKSFFEGADDSRKSSGPGPRREWKEKSGEGCRRGSRGRRRAGEEVGARLGEAEAAAVVLVVAQRLVLLHATEQVHVERQLQRVLGHLGDVAIVAAASGRAAERGREQRDQQQRRRRGPAAGHFSEGIDSEGGGPVGCRRKKKKNEGLGTVGGASLPGRNAAQCAAPWPKRRQAGELLAPGFPGARVFPLVCAGGAIGARVNAGQAAVWLSKGANARRSPPPQPPIEREMRLSRRRARRGGRSRPGWATCGAPARAVQPRRPVRPQPLQSQKRPFCGSINAAGRRPRPRSAPGAGRGDAQSHTCSCLHRRRPCGRQHKLCGRSACT